MDGGRDRSRSPRGDDEIASLVIQREQARQAKDWSLADGLRDQLAALGVTLFDKTNSWKCSDGRSGRIPTWAEIEGDFSPDVLQTTQPVQGPWPTADSMPINGGDSTAHIKQLVQMREQARASKDFSQSDKIRDELHAMGVELFDKEKTWRSKDGQAGVIMGYRGSASPTDVEISTLVVQREKARQNNDFTMADMIRDELKAVGVDIFDKDKTWRCSDGRSGVVPSWSAIAGGSVAPTSNVTPGAFGPADLKQQIVQAALQAASNPANAARVLQLLQQFNAGVVTPAIGVGRPAQMTPTQKASTPIAPVKTPTSQSPEVQDALSFISQCQSSGRAVTDSEIEWLVTVREKLRQNKEYSAADEIRNAIRTHLGVELQEKEKRWTANDGRQGVIPLWGTM